MKSHGAIIGALISLSLLSTSCASAGPALKAAQFPRELHGVWEGGVTSCKKPGNLDSDVRIEITGHKLFGYEDSQDPLEVTQLSEAPLAWKVRSRLHVYEDASELTEIFVISGRNGGQLTIVGESQSMQYERCL
jgi:hypothetical protein